MQDSGKNRTTPGPHHHSGSARGGSGGPLLNWRHSSDSWLFSRGENFNAIETVLKLVLYMFYICVNGMYIVMFHCSDKWSDISPLSNQEPSITEIKPDYGPVFGGTTVTLIGRYLDSGLQRDVFFADKKCNIQRWTTKKTTYFANTWLWSTSHSFHCFQISLLN